MKQKGNLFLIVSILMMVLVFLLQTMIELGRLQYEISIKEKQTLHLYALAEESMDQYIAGINKWIGSRQKEIEGIKIPNKEIKTVRYLQQELYKESYDTNMQSRFVSSYTYKVGTNSTTIKGRVYLKESLGNIRSEEKELKDLVRNIWGIEEGEHLEGLLVKIGALTTDEQKELESLQIRWKEQEDLIGEIVVETFNSKGKVIDKKRLVAGYTLLLPMTGSGSKITCKCLWRYKIQ